ncbi:hypothetical protein [Frankia sp. Cas3]|uniref:hypothetical protein n=1 Tax=Frankia sp. Cas3 TaxID=3073926 RepID=UPI002AD468EE|nr:hypothetical protein [Frankia sp. Cas3]
MSDSTSGTTTYGYDGWDRLAVRNSTTLGYAGVEKEPVGDGTSTYARDPDGNLIGLGTPGGNWVPLADPHGDVVAALTTNGAGLTDQKAFDPFGVPTTAGSANVRVGFQGSWTDPTTAKVSAEARWYTPGDGWVCFSGQCGSAVDIRGVCGPWFPGLVPAEFSPNLDVAGAGGGGSSPAMPAGSSSHAVAGSCRGRVGRRR